MAISTEKTIAANKSNAKAAAYLEAGRVANNQLLKLAKPKLPMAIRGYADHPASKLVIANLVQLAVEQFKPHHPQAQALSQAMICQAYQEIYQSFDVESMLDTLLDDPTIGKALKKLD